MAKRKTAILKYPSAVSFLAACAMTELNQHRLIMPPGSNARFHVVVVRNYDPKIMMMALRRMAVCALKKLEYIHTCSLHRLK